MFIFGDFFSFLREMFYETPRSCKVFHLENTFPFGIEHFLTLSTVFTLLSILVFAIIFQRRGLYPWFNAASCLQWIGFIRAFRKIVLLWNKKFAKNWWNSFNIEISNVPNIAAILVVLVRRGEGYCRANWKDWRLLVRNPGSIILVHDYKILNYKCWFEPSIP